MDNPVAAALAKRLGAYSAAAGVTLLGAQNAGAQVVYHDLDPDVVVDHNLPDGPYDLDFDDDGAADLTFLACDVYNNICSYVYNRYYTTWVYFQRPGGAHAQNGVLGYDAPNYGNPAIGVASRFSSGDGIGPAGAGQGFYGVAIAAKAALGLPVAYPFTNQAG